MDCSPPGSSYPWDSSGILEWVAMPFSRGSFWPRDTTQVPALWADSLQFELLAFDISINVPAATSSCLLPMVCLMSLICYGHRNKISHFISLWCNIRLSRLQVSQRLSNVAKGHGFVAGFVFWLTCDSHLYS